MRNSGPLWKTRENIWFLIWEVRDFKINFTLFWHEQPAIQELSEHKILQNRSFGVDNSVNYMKKINIFNVII